MCGVAVVWDPLASPAEVESRCMAVRDAQVHRGPDDAGLWTDREAGIVIGHRRLAILDLTSAGHQPMVSHTGRWIVAFNGEIYNFGELRAHTPAVRWRGHSDTEVLTALFDQLGFEDALPLISGMFAICAWDRQERTLWLARDRLGQKPLYWSAARGSVTVASELRAVIADPSVDRRADPEATQHLLEFGHLHAPKTFVRGIQQIVPGGWVRLTQGRPPTEGRYWSLLHAANQPRSWSSFAEASASMESLIQQAVASHAVADVPVGVLLSGGIDSSLVAALLSKTGSKVKTYTIGVDGPGFDESALARQIAAHLGTDHTDLRLGLPELQREIPTLVQDLDEPLGDASLIPTRMVCRLARGAVTVALGGDGGDEVFGGYSRYTTTIRLWERLRRVPRAFRKALGGALEGVTRAYVAGRLGAGARRTLGLRRARQLAVDDLLDLYHLAIQATPSAHVYLRGRPTQASAPEWPRVDGDPVRTLMVFDALHYLPDEVLVKVDRAAMAASLETRAPLLDPAVVEAGLTLPADWTWAGGQGKKILKDILARHVPRPLWDRPKQGFGVPLAAWLRGPLRPWAEDLLHERSLSAVGILEAEPVAARWREHQRGANHEKLLWTLLQIQAWARAHRIGPP